MAVNTNILTDIDSSYKEGEVNSELIKGPNAIKNMVMNLFKTTSQQGDMLGERPYENTYGCNLERYLFQPLDDTTALNIRDTIYDSVCAWIPEVFITQNSILVVPDYDHDAYMVYVAYIYQGNPDDLEFTISRKAR